MMTPELLTPYKLSGVLLLVECAESYIPKARQLDLFDAETAARLMHSFAQLKSDTDREYMHSEEELKSIFDRAGTVTDFLVQHKEYMPAALRPKIVEALMRMQGKL
jgi:transcriptional regulator of NAD metabolism